MASVNRCHTPHPPDIAFVATGPQIGAMPPPLPPVHPLKGALVEQVRALFNDRAAGEAPVERSDDALFAPDSVVWRVHGDVAAMMVGGIAALLLQMLHPRVLAGVWDHSNFRADMLGRLRRTARFIALTTYGPRDQAEAAIARVRRIHHVVRGTLPDGTPYAADDPSLLAWVHVTEMTSFLAGWRRYGDPAMTGHAQDRYFAEVARIGRALGADPVPETRADAETLMQAMRPQLRVDDRTREMVRVLRESAAPGMAAHALQAFAFQAAVDLLPDWARRCHGLATPRLARPVIRAGTFGVAETLRWAFR